MLCGHGDDGHRHATTVPHYDLLVRDVGSFRKLNAHWMRIASQRPGENCALVEAIRRWMQP